MNQEFEAIVMGNYAELCIMWRIAHVRNPNQAKGFDAKLRSLESVIDAFGMAMPDLSDSDFSDQVAAGSGSGHGQGSGSVPTPRPVGSGGGVMLED